MSESYIWIGVIVFIVKIIILILCRVMRSESEDSSGSRNRTYISCIFYLAPPAQIQYRPPQIVPAMQGSTYYPVPPVQPTNPSVPRFDPYTNNHIVSPVRNPNGNAGGSSLRTTSKKKAELLLMKFEKKLLISCIRLDRVREIFTKVSRGGFVESESAKETFRKIAVKDGNDNVNVGNFIDSIKNNGGCNLKHLMLAAILISVAEEEVKAKELFDMYVDRNSGSIDLKSIMVIVACGFVMSVESLPNLIGKNEKLSRVKKYTEKLERWRNLYNQRVNKMVSEHGGSFRKETFIGLLVSKFSFLMKSSSIRIFAHSIYKKNKSD